MSIKTFEEYLQSIHKKQYNGSEEEQANDFDNWVMGLSEIQLMEHEDRFNGLLFVANADD